MAAVKHNLAALLDAYTGGRHWVWGERDCIGLMIHVVNAVTGAGLQRDRYIAPMSYDESVDWLQREFRRDPFKPYRAFCADAGIAETTDTSGAQIIVVVGGDSVISGDGSETYPVHRAPGVLFQTSDGVQYALMRRGLQAICPIDADPPRRVIRFPLAETR